MAILYDNEGNQITMSEVAANASDISNLKTTSTALVDNKEILGAKNMLPLDIATIKSLNTSGTWSGNSYTLNGVTFTFNSNGSIATSGTSNTNFSVTLFSGSISLNADLILTGCPTNGSLATYGLSYNGGAGVDIGNGEDISNNTTITSIAIRIMSACSMSGLTFYPMLRLASDNNPTYQPYAMGNQELTQKVLDLEARVTALET